MAKKKPSKDKGDDLVSTIKDEKETAEKVADALLEDARHEPVTVPNIPEPPPSGPTQDLIMFGEPRFCDKCGTGLVCYGNSQNAYCPACHSSYSVDRKVGTVSLVVASQAEHHEPDQGAEHAADPVTALASLVSSLNADIAEYERLRVQIKAKQKRIGVLKTAYEEAVRAVSVEV